MAYLLHSSTAISLLLWCVLEHKITLCNNNIFYKVYSNYTSYTRNRNIALQCMGHYTGDSYEYINSEIDL